ncbi:pentatricopeptide repeat-containing protein At4g38010 [Arachis duranensis]|uniref:Pentatricopeptide repeat-containing protein At4g38010 n=1 Tax=Arachis duranensis TaxID=130453 RepID=A0A6P5N530_ARADU|nr:pentatricopeptide repeat-containing protein At4g38010 [Arachis duranensis]XP_020991916.1 pentatricopeptide repeat-containing protein At4g38010 [Arachis duranensis]XP_020991918.1 pentatricopeptide repeat-containing protein At4g38010 [Arachis duranensis]XP_025635123.1 pentatricopeptide repeat-containing protein At4g38010 [Arachis hypogaea]XP_025663910.1 pentatricopeptide repeat-containing protein At4g38010 [Arachis hypogaea]XP_025663911.1 pentatricopeptide repeat-containing protein At4g38010 
MNKATQSLKWVLLEFIDKCKDLRSFKKIHAQLLTSALVSNDLVVAKVANLFGKHVTNVHYTSNYLKQLDWSLSSFPCNLFISSYASSHSPRAAIIVYRWVFKNGFVPDVFTVPAVLKSCARFSGIFELRQLHAVVVRNGLWCDMYVQNSLVHVYNICGDNASACKVFDEMPIRDVVSWTGLISGSVKAGLFDDAIALFLRMDVEPNLATIVSIFGAIGKLGRLNLGKGVHGLVVKCPYGKELVVDNALMDMYMKCESVADARQVFDEMPEKDIISWTSMIGGLVRCQFPNESLNLFYEMQASGFEPDGVILTSVLSASASLGLLEYGRWVHEYIDCSCIKQDVHIGTALVDMYAKCGCIEMAQRVFNDMPSKNIRTWNAFIGGLAINGHGQEALKQFEELIESGTRPNEVTFLAIFTACCHSGLVDEGRRLFNQMTSPSYNISPWLEHYGCMVDLFCRAGLVGEAMELIKTMPMPPDVQILGALLSACSTYENVGFSQEMLKSLQNFEYQDSGIYVLLSNLYAASKKWTEVRSLRRQMKKKGINKVPGSSIIRVDGKSHEFLVGDNDHPQSEDIRVVLNTLANQIDTLS